MRRKQIVLLSMLALLAALIAWIAVRNKKPPFLPSDAIHSTAAGTETCLTCHGPDGAMPRSKNHPQATDCFRCHVSR